MATLTSLLLCGPVCSKLRCTVCSETCQSWPALNFSHATLKPHGDFNILADILADWVYVDDKKMSQTNMVLPDFYLWEMVNF